ncbi:hypothetical protein AFK24_16535 [Pseudomonas syringae]|uniref:DUF1652 domain-containing protein n=2 Tax=Pseudomonas TaxID=286 RepID=A0A1C7Z266_PSESX|nr:DUF1652 domain-containing protein [Pseudomonas syringae]OCR24102.1 hypothetical protein AFK24_16535 [Pseudomonas syringae]
MTYLAQVRQLIEHSFEPMACDCTVSPDGSLMVRIYDRDSGRVDLVVTGIAVDKLKSHEAVLTLIEELRDELTSVSMSSVLGQPSQA